jgi:1-acyl-sn-glycerol-3-phosphate acyltransferase
VILAPNHFSFLDHFFLGVALRRKVHFMAKSQLFKPPMEKVFSPGGVFPVRRGFADDEAFVTAVAVLDRGDTMAMYAEGGRSRTGELSKKPRRGIGRLALLSGAPVVPVAIVGSSHVRNWKRLQFPKVTVYYGEPFAYERVEAPTRDQEQAAADAIFAEVRALYDKATARLGHLSPASAGRALPGTAARSRRPRPAPPRPPTPRSSGRRRSLRRRVGAVGGEHRGEHRDAERPPTSRIALVAPEAWPASCGRRRSGRRWRSARRPAPCPCRRG